jgi:hypothetical protein
MSLQETDLPRLFRVEEFIVGRREPLATIKAKSGIDAMQKVMAKFNIVQPERRRRIRAVPIESDRRLDSQTTKP